MLSIQVMSHTVPSAWCNMKRFAMLPECFSMKILFKILAENKLSQDDMVVHAFTAYISRQRHFGSQQYTASTGICSSSLFLQSISVAPLLPMLGNSKMGGGVANIGRIERLVVAVISRVGL